MKYCPGRSNIRIKSNPKFLGDRPIMTIGYEYRSWKILGFIATGGMETLFQVSPIYLITMIFSGVSAETGRVIDPQRNL